VFEHAQVERLLPAAVIVLRAAIETAECQLREAHPAVGELVDLSPAVVTDARYGALSPVEVSALNGLRWMANVAQRLNQGVAMTLQDWVEVLDWPAGLPAPESLEHKVTAPWVARKGRWNGCSKAGGWSDNDNGLVVRGAHDNSFFPLAFRRQIGPAWPQRELRDHVGFSRVVEASGLLGRQRLLAQNRKPLADRHGRPRGPRPRCGPRCRARAGLLHSGDAVRRQWLAAARGSQ
jgi:hypothetical protein